MPATAPSANTYPLAVDGAPRDLAVMIVEDDGGRRGALARVAADGVPAQLYEPTDLVRVGDRSFVPARDLVRQALTTRRTPWPLRFVLAGADFIDPSRQEANA